MNVVAFAPKPNSKVIEQIEELLLRAKAGELVSILFICETSDGSRFHGGTEGRDGMALLADATRLAHLMQIRLDRALTDAPPPPASPT